MMLLCQQWDLGSRVHLLGQNHLAVMPTLARTVQLIQSEVVARRAWAPAEGSLLKWSLMLTFLGMMKRGYMQMLFRICDAHISLKSKMRLTVSKKMRMKTFHLFNGTLRTLICKKVPFFHP